MLNFDVKQLTFSNLLNTVELDLAAKELGIEKLAWLGDAIYELYIRTAIFQAANLSRNLHRINVRFVNAAFQARLLKYVHAKQMLTAEEEKFVKRARNFHSHSQAKNQDPLDYQYATALEALLGLLFCENKVEKIGAIIACIVEMELEHE